MTDTLTPVERAQRMRSVRQFDTDIEMRVRSLIHRSGYRFSLGRRDLPGSPDIVLSKHKVVCFVHGCFWHGHDCRAGRLPATNHEWWAAKIDANRKRDEAAAAECSETGWRVLTVWQCALKGKCRMSCEEVRRALTSAIQGGACRVHIKGKEGPNPSQGSRDLPCND